MNKVVAAGASTNPAARRAVGEALSRAARRLAGRKPSYGFLFASPDMDLAAVLREARLLHPHTDFIATTTAGEITELGLTHGGLAVMLVAADRDQHMVLFSSQAAAPSDAVRDVSAAFLDRRRAGWSGAATTVLLTDGLAGTGENLVDELRTRIGGALHEIVGGAAGDEGRFTGTFVGANEASSRGAVAALHVVDTARWGVGVQHGLTPATPLMRVTKAEGSVVHELNGRPAFDAYKSYAESLGVALEAATAPTFLVNNELGVVLFDQLRKARAPMRVNADGSLVCAAAIPQGASVCILRGSREDLVTAARAAAAEAKERLGTRRAAGVLLFDCICRGAILGEDFHREIDAVRDVFPDVPIAGFLTYGEIARYSGKLDGWHNTTAVVVAIPE